MSNNVYLHEQLMWDNGTHYLIKHSSVVGGEPANPVLRFDDYRLYRYPPTGRDDRVLLNIFTNYDKAINFVGEIDE